MRVATLQDSYAEIGRNLLSSGRIEKSRASGASPRTKELVGFDLHIEDPRRSLPVGTGRKLHPAVGVVEALQLVGGWSDPELQCRVAPNMRSFMDAGAFHGAYGLRVAQQVPLLIDRLRSDATSRQGVLTIWDPQRDAFDGPRDLPCTVTLQFLIRNDALECLAYMRSNDFWWGLAYDAFQFTQLQMTLAHFLDLDLGSYHHFVGSFHAYERDWESIEDLHAPARPGLHPWTPGFANDTDREWKSVAARTRDIVRPVYSSRAEHAWYHETMKPFAT